MPPIAVKADVRRMADKFGISDEVKEKYFPKLTLEEKEKLNQQRKNKVAFRRNNKLHEK